MLNPRASYLFLIAAPVLFGLSAYQYFEPRRPDVRFVIDQPERDLGQVAVGKEQTVRFIMRNPARTPVRVVGLKEC
jgi:hypothetical protein